MSSLCQLKGKIQLDLSLVSDCLLSLLSLLRVTVFILVYLLRFNSAELNLSSFVLFLPAIIVAWPVDEWG